MPLLLRQATSQSPRGWPLPLPASRRRKRSLKGRCSTVECSAVVVAAAVGTVAVRVEVGVVAAGGVAGVVVAAAVLCISRTLDVKNLVQRLLCNYVR